MGGQPKSKASLFPPLKSGGCGEEPTEETGLKSGSVGILSL
jgi:hypothetical protein